MQAPPAEGENLMLTSFEQEHALVSQGWLLLREADICWLDCPEPAFCYRIRGRSQHIVLCLRHAMVLQAGAWRGDYSGAPVPPDSRATAWPWQPLWQEYAAA